jgi:hypothetical protein
MAGVRSLARKNFSLRHNVQPSDVACPASCPVGTGVVSSGVKGPWCETNNSAPSSAEVENVCVTTGPLLHTYAWPGV